MLANFMFILSLLLITEKVKIERKYNTKIKCPLLYSISLKLSGSTLTDIARVLQIQQ